MHIGIIFGIAAAISLGVWTVFHQQASQHINSLFAAIIIGLVEVIVGILILLPFLSKSKPLISDPRGIIFVVLAGIAALAIVFFVLRAYSSGVPVSIIGPIVIGGSIAIAAVIGLFLGESITFIKIVGLLFTIAGAAILATLSK